MPSTTYRNIRREIGKPLYLQFLSTQPQVCNHSTTISRNPRIQKIEYSTRGWLYAIIKRVSEVVMTTSRRKYTHTLIPSHHHFAPSIPGHLVHLETRQYYCPRANYSFVKLVQHHRWGNQSETNPAGVPVRWMGYPSDQSL